MKRLLSTIFLILLLCLPVAAQAKQDTLLEILQDNEDFSTFLAFVEAAGIEDFLDRNDVSLTLFVPTNDGFSFLTDELIDTMLDDQMFAANILLSHMVAGEFDAAALRDLETLDSLQGEEIDILTLSGSIMVGFGFVEDADVEASNGMIYSIDGILVPMDLTITRANDIDRLLEVAVVEETTTTTSVTASSLGVGSNSSDDDTTTTTAAEPCFVSAATANTVQIRVGPGENRTAVSFLATGSDFEVQGQTADDNGNVWYQLDKDEAAPTRAINEAWVDARLVDETGDCASVIDTNAPPIIPIINQPPTNTDTGGGGDTGSDSGNTTAPAGLPGNGRYTIVLASNMNASCVGTNNISIPTSSMGYNTSFTVSVSANSNSITVGPDVHTNVGGYYQGQWQFAGDTVTVRLYPQNSRYFTGELIVSFQVQGVWCSGTIGFSASR